MIPRTERLKELFKVEINQALRSVKDPGLSGFLTITDCEVSPDLKNARIYYSILGSSRERASTGKALERAIPFIRRTIRKRMSMKFIPQLQFFYDDTPSRASRVERMFHIIEQEKKP